MKHKTLCTFSGKFGDILWSLTTVREIAKIDGNLGLTKCDFGIMTQYRSLLQLLNAQSYIDKAFVIENWECIGSPHGDQPFEAPVPEGYDKVYHLTYRNHPGKNEPLIDFIARQQGITLQNPIPFIQASGFIDDSPEGSELYNLVVNTRNRPTIAYAFNDSMKESKDKFLDELKSRVGSDVQFLNVQQYPWLTAKWIIQESIAFVGCRSANYVLACGLGKKVFVYEPNVSRSKFGPWGTTFCCPYADETEISYVSIYQLVDYIKSKISEVTNCA